MSSVQGGQGDAHADIYALLEIDVYLGRVKARDEGLGGSRYPGSGVYDG
jgi:hypothetical protein